MHIHDDVVCVCQLVCRPQLCVCVCNTGCKFHHTGICWSVFGPSAAQKGADSCKGTSIQGWFKIFDRKNCDRMNELARLDIWAWGHCGLSGKRKKEKETPSVCVCSFIFLYRLYIFISARSLCVSYTPCSLPFLRLPLVFIFSNGHFCVCVCVCVSVIDLSSSPVSLSGAGRRRRAVRYMRLLYMERWM